MAVRGCRIFVAAAGYGKTTAVHAGGPVVRHPAAGMSAWPAGVESPAHLLVDDVAELGAPALRRLAAILAGRPGPISLCSRRPLPARVLAALPGPVTEYGAADLALTPEAVARVLRDEHGIVDADTAYLVHEVTAGWPALVQFAGDAAAGALSATAPLSRAVLLDALGTPGSRCATWIRHEVLPGLPPGVARLLRLVAGLDPVAAPLCARLRGDDPRRVAEELRWLTVTGFLTPHPDHPGPDGWLRLVPVVDAVLAPHARPDRLRTAATWYAGHGQPLAAANALRRGGDDVGWRILVRAHGDAILAAGGAADLVPDLARAVDDRSDEPDGPAGAGAWRLLLGDALRMTGDATGALRAFEPLIAEADRTGIWPPALVWRAAMVHYMRSDYRAALDLCSRVPDTRPGPDVVFVAACRASVLTMLGESEAARHHAELALASTVHCDRSLAAAHIACALAALGVRRDEHLALALAAADRAGDVVAQARVLVNQADGLLRQARYAPALELGERAVRAAQRGSPPGLLAVALCNTGEALLRLGRYDEATLHFERAVLISRRAGLNRTAMGLWGLAEIDRLLGRREQSRGAFDEAAHLARAAADGQVLVPVLCGLARLLLDDGDPAGARVVADEAEGVASSLLAARGLVARGWVALADGDLGMARQKATAAVQAAREARRADALAESLELAAAVTPDQAEARSTLVEAEGIWRRAGAGPAADRVVILLGRLPGSDSSQRAATRAAAVRLRSLGVEVNEADADTTAPVRVRVLGRFEVLVAGRPVPLPAWRSRQARSLLKILLARRGSPIARTELAELLWPDDDAQRTGHRLSVLLSAVRTVLDPARLWPVDHHVRSDVAGICVDIDHLLVDVEDLIRDAHEAAALIRRGEPDRAREILVEVDEMYRGDAFSDEPYEDWSTGLREEARAVWLRSLRTLAELSRATGDPDQAVTCLVRLLAADPFDEAAHAALVDLLVRTGRHGEARRAFDRWAGAMKTIDAPAPDQRRLRPIPTS